MHCPFTSTLPHHERGISLLESLVAFVVLALGAAAVAQLQSQLRLGGDVARERSEAVRLAATAMDEMRAFAALEAASGARSYAAIGDADRVVDAASAPMAHASYRLERRIDERAFAAVKAAAVSVRWNDRQGGAREVVLHSFVARAAPIHAGALAVGAGAVLSATRGAAGRAPSVPITARQLGDRRSASKPSEHGATALIFDDRSGAVVARCDAIAMTIPTRDLSAATLAGCSSGRWLSVAGTIRFAADSGADLGALRAGVAIELRDGAYPATPSCFAEARKTVRYLVDGSLHLDDVAVEATPADAGLTAWADTGDRFIAWQCIVAPRADGRWSGHVTVVPSGWTIGSDAGSRRVCRGVGGGGATIDANIATAGDDRDIGAALLGRNFLVVRGDSSCPGEAASP